MAKLGDVLNNLIFSLGGKQMYKKDLYIQQENSY